jgi:hypothetical protein
MLESLLRPGGHIGFVLQLIVYGVSPRIDLKV